MPKNPRNAKSKGSNKIKSQNTGVSTNNETPVFCFAKQSPSHSLDRCENDEKIALVTRLALLSKNTWQDLQKAHRHGLGHEKIDKTSIIPSIPTFITPDVNVFIAFRFKGKASMIGYRLGRIFHIVWIDTKFDVYDHGS